MKVRIEYGGTYDVDMETGACFVAGTTVRITGSKRVKKLRELAAAAQPK